MTTSETLVRAIIDVSHRYAAGIDRRDWGLYAECFTDPCDFDFSSFSGKPAASLRRDVWVDNVRRTNGSFDATQHQMSNQMVTMVGDQRAICVTELRAQHWFSETTMERLGHPGAENFCELGGHYTNEIVFDDGAWRISKCMLTVRWQTGSMAIFDLARAIGAGTISKD
ncbi:MAG: hypothetical protein RL726_2043 [Actinomycetota bacterium]